MSIVSLRTISKKVKKKQKKWETIFSGLNVKQKKSNLDKLATPEAEFGRVPILGIWKYKL